MKSSFKKVSMAALALGITALAATATKTLAIVPIGGGCGGRYCPDNYSPVICPDGRVYSNACVAGRACQKNCVPYGAAAF